MSESLHGLLQVQQTQFRLRPNLLALSAIVRLPELPLRLLLVHANKLFVEATAPGRYL